MERGKRKQEIGNRKEETEKKAQKIISHRDHGDHRDGKIGNRIEDREKVQVREKLASQLCADRISVPSGYVFSRLRSLTICIFFIPGKYLLKIEKFRLGVLSAHFTSIIKKGASSLMTKKSISLLSFVLR